MGNKLSYEEIEENISILNNFIGYGNPTTGKFWFMGIEEGGSSLGIERVHDFKEYNKNLEKTFTLAQEDYLETPPTETGSVDILISNYLGTPKTGQRYWSNHGNGFKLNLYPFNKPSEDSNYIEEIKAFLGVNNSIQLKESDIHKTRIENLKHFFNEHFIGKNKILFCMGSGHWDDFEEFLESLIPDFKLSAPISLTDKSRGNRSFKHWREQIFFVDHPSYKWLSLNQMEELRNKYGLL